MSGDGVGHDSNGEREVTVKETTFEEQDKERKLKPYHSRKF